ncbi:hypothetical protein LIER_12056 [Lithospermum erythrorhizon]|uniref:Uncharacterized protein n=1 Tax=Lithospermum erythrorhizon TaxID=34254 RepID=A0AAV3PQB6_LITER
MEGVYVFPISDTKIGCGSSITINKTLFLRAGSTLIHIFREKNMAADQTAKITREEGHFSWDQNIVQRRLNQLNLLEQRLSHIRS